MLMMFAFPFSSHAEWCEWSPCLQPEGVHVPDAEQEVPQRGAAGAGQALHELGEAWFH